MWRGGRCFNPGHALSKRYLAKRSPSAPERSSGLIPCLLYVVQNIFRRAQEALDWVAHKLSNAVTNYTLLNVTARTPRTRTTT